MTDAPHIDVEQRYLTVEEARRMMRDELNIPVSARLMRAIVSERRLPFFKSVDSRMRIGERTLKRTLAAQQAADLTRTRTQRGAVASQRTFWDYRDLDRAMLDLEKLREHLPQDALEQAVRSYIKAGGRKLGGVVIFENTETRVR